MMYINEEYTIIGNDLRRSIMRTVWSYKYPIGTIWIAEENDTITCVTFKGHDKYISDYDMTETPLIQKAAMQLTEYFEGRRTEFNLPLSVQGTTFQQSVWKALQTIPYGETRSYKEIATQIGNPKAARAVGMANNRNPISIIIPCHRVIGHEGDLVGYGGGLSIKQYLLDLEKEQKNL